MSGPREQIENDVKQALKSGDKERLSTLRLLLAEIKNEAIRAGEPVDDNRFVDLVRKGIKQRRDSAEGFRKGGREESAAKEEREIAVLEEYLPQQASEDELRAAIEELVAAESLSGPAAMGTVMKTMMARFGGAADGRTLSRLAREILAG